MRSRLVILTASITVTIGCGGVSGRGDAGRGGGGDLSGEVASDGGGKPFDRDAACARVSASATLGKKPVDIIFVIDNSGSMTEEIVGVEKNINGNFAQIIGASGLDYRIIILSKFGSAGSDQSICVAAPLSGNSCPSSAPVNTSKFFHYDNEITSSNSFSEILRTYNAADPRGQGPGGWSDWVRADSFKAFIEITDDDADMSASAFEAGLFALTPARFGTAMKRDYIFQSIVGLKEKSTKTQAYQPSEPVQKELCCHTTLVFVCTDGAEASGDDYQDLSKLTGGLRFPVCQYDGYDAVFQEVAKGVIGGAKVSCDFPLPTPPMGQTIDLGTVIVEYTPSGGGNKMDLTQVKDASQCGPGKFYIDSTQKRVYICPDSCAAIQLDPMAQVNVLFDCDLQPM